MKDDLKTLLHWWDCTQPPDYEEVYDLIEMLRAEVARLTAEREEAECEARDLLDSEDL